MTPYSRINFYDKFIIDDEISEDILKRNLIHQLNQRILLENSAVDYLGTFRHQYDEYPHDDYVNNLETINRITSDVYHAVLNTLNRKFLIELAKDEDYYLSPDDFYDDIDILYHFFILRYCEILVKFLFLKIWKNKEFYARNYSILKEMTDFFALAHKREEDYPLLHKLSDIIKDISSDIASLTDVIQIVYESEPENELYRKIYEMAIINPSGGFIFNNNESEGSITAYKKFMSVLDNPEVFEYVKNLVFLDLQRVISENMKQAEVNKEEEIEDEGKLN